MIQSRRRRASTAVEASVSETTNEELGEFGVDLGTGPLVEVRREAVDVRADLRAIEMQLNDTFVERKDAIRVILLGVLSRTNYMLIGDPGTAKTSVIDCFIRHVQVGTRFKTLMGKFTQPEHIVGVLDINAFKMGRYETVTAGMLTEAELPILDETLKTSDGCMNSLLGILGPEREFQGKRTRNIAVGGATNWPEVESLSKHVEALYDRFLLRCAVAPVDRSNQDLRRSLYRAEGKVKGYAPTTFVTTDDLNMASDALSQIDISDAVIDMLDGVVLRLVSPKKDTSGKERPSDIHVSDRRATQLQMVLRANAWLEGRDFVSIEDFEVLRHGLWSRKKDLESIVAVLGTLDSHYVQQLVRDIDEGRKAYKQLEATGFSTSKINEVAETLRKIAYDVKQALEQPLFTTKGRNQIRESMRNLHADFKKLNERANQVAGQG